MSNQAVPQLLFCYWPQLKSFHYNLSPLKLRALTDSPEKKTLKIVPDAPKPAWIASTTRPAMLVSIASWKLDVNKVKPPAPRHGIAGNSNIGSMSTKNSMTSPEWFLNNFPTF